MRRLGHGLAILVLLGSLAGAATVANESKSVNGLVDNLADGGVLLASATDDSPAAAGQKAKSEELGEQLRVAQRALDAAKSVTPKGINPPEELKQNVDLLQQIKTAESQLGAAKERHNELKSTQDELEANFSVVSGGGALEQPESEFLLLDQLRDQLAVEQDRAQTTTTELAAATDALARAKSVYDEKERRRRTAKEAVDTRKPDAEETDKARLEQALKLAQAESQLAETVVALREAELANERLDAENHAARLRLLKLRIEAKENQATFHEEDLSRILSQIEERESDLREKAETIQLESDFPERQWREAMDRRSNVDEGMDPVLDAEIEAWRRARESHRAELAAINEQLNHLAKAKTVWNRRFKIATDQVDAAELIIWRKETRQAIDEINASARGKTGRIAELRGELSSLDSQLQDARQTPNPAARWIGEQREHVAALIEHLGGSTVTLETSRRLHEKLFADIEGDAKSSGIGSWLATAWSWITAIWNHELTSVDDRPITVGKIFSGVILLLMGFWFSRWLSRVVARRVLSRFHLHEGAIAALQTVFFYLLVITFALFALRLVNVPLTAFTILGGALAVGVGFGSQNIVNNFFSGLILLAERPVRVGDVVETEGIIGTVERIGARSTWVRTATNFEIIIPNSSLLQNNVVNWTLSDDKIRTSVKIGVAYGSPTRDVSRLLKKAADEHGLVLDNPEPFVWFTDFADNALTFELHFWLQMRTIGERRRIESDLRHIIDQRFREGGIVIAYPQRDVHLDVTRPLDVRFVQQEEQRSEAA